MRIARIVDFYRDERGGMTLLILVLFTGIILMTGFALDLLRQESARADLQAALDRGVLAAASATQTVDAETVVGEYVDGRIWDGVAAHISVATDVGATGRQVSAQSSFAIDSMFLQIAGLEQLPVPAAAAATQAFTNVEISLVLDISGTMRFNSGNNYIEGAGLRRIEFLRPAANNFIDTMLGGSGSGQTTISLIRYAGQVNPGPVMFGLLGGVPYHTDSSCIEFNIDDFVLPDPGGGGGVIVPTGLPEPGTYTQVPHFHHWWLEPITMDWGWCPSDGEQIVYLSNDAEALKAEIDSIRLHDGTGTYNAMKWALGLLDPSSQPVIASLVSAGLVDPGFQARPLNWTGDDSDKIIVLMTDGQITGQYRPDDPLDPRLDTMETQPSEHGIPWSQVFSSDDGFDAFIALCDAAKLQGVTIYTIAFNAPSAARDQMYECASGDPLVEGSKEMHFFDVQDEGINDAFDEIAAQILKLRLIQ